MALNSHTVDQSLASFVRLQGNSTIFDQLRPSVAKVDSRPEHNTSAGVSTCRASTSTYGPLRRRRLTSQGALGILLILLGRHGLRG